MGQALGLQSGGVGSVVLPPERTPAGQLPPWPVLSHPAPGAGVGVRGRIPGVSPVVHVSGGGLAHF